MHPIGHLTNIRRSDGAPEPDGALKVVVRKKIIHYRQLYIDHPEPISFMPVAVDTSDRIYDDFLRLLFLDTHREASALTNDIPEESGHFRFLDTVCLTFPCFFSSTVLPKRWMKGSYLRVLPAFLTLHSFSVTFFTLGFRLF